jgi:hypothetical protein
MSQWSKLALLLSGLSLCGLTLDSAFAQNASSSTTAPKARSAQSIECSKEADAKGLHGKARKKFRSACKKGTGSGGGGKQDVD